MAGSPQIERPCHLVGDEECGVGLHCSSCDTGGAPVVWYDGYGVANPYPETDVPTAHTLAELLALGDHHVRDVHGGAP